MATEQQLNTLVKMCEERGLDTTPVLVEQKMQVLDNARVQHLFQVLKSKPKLPMPSTVEPVEYSTKKKEAAAEGGYQVGETIYKVKIGKSGYRYAMILDGVTAKGKPNWVQVKGLVFELLPADKMTKEQVKAFGDLYHHCIYCGLELTRPESLDRGCGWKCASKHGIL